MSKTVIRNLCLSLTLVAAVIVLRLLPHPANFAPVAATALLAGAVLPMSWALATTLGAMVASDLLIGLHPLVLVTWGSFLLAVIIGRGLIAGRIGSKRVVIGSLAASLSFFLITNFAVWLEGRLYPQTIEGLWQCYLNALPFLRNTVTGDLVYSGMLFGGYLTYMSVYHRRRIRAVRSA